MDKSSRYERRAKVIEVERLTPTGTIRFSFQVIDGRPFNFTPGNFVGIDCDLPKLGYRRSPYCIFSPPNEECTFQHLIRVVPDGPVSNFLSSLKEGDVISFRGPTGRSMIPKESDTELILLTTGVGLGPFNSLIRHLLACGFMNPIRLYWGLRLVEDICLLDELDEIASQHANFSYQISLSQPPQNWRGLRGRLTESVPSLLETLGGKHFYLTRGRFFSSSEIHSCSLSELMRNYKEHKWNVPQNRNLPNAEPDGKFITLFSPSTAAELGVARHRHGL